MFTATITATIARLTPAATNVAEAACWQTACISLHGALASRLAGLAGYILLAP